MDVQDPRPVRNGLDKTNGLRFDSQISRSPVVAFRLEFYREPERPVPHGGAFNIELQPHVEGERRRELDR